MEYTLEDLLVPKSEILENDKKNVLYLGNLTFSEDRESLKSLKVDYVLTVTRSVPNIDYKRMNIKWLHLEVGDTVENDIFKIFDEAINFIDDSLEKGNVLVHCDAGQSRSGTIVIAYVMKKMKKSFEESLEFVRRKRRCVVPNKGFIVQLKRYEEVIKDQQ